MTAREATEPGATEPGAIAAEPRHTGAPERGRGVAFRRWVRGEAGPLVELVAMCGYVIAQPAFDSLSQNVFVVSTRRITSVELVAIALGILVVPPFVLWAAEVAVGLVARRARTALHVAILAGLAGLLTIAVVKPRTTLGSLALVAAALAAAAGFAALWSRFQPVRTWLRVSAVGAPLFALMFVGLSPVAEAVRSADRAALDVEIEEPIRVVMIVFDELPLQSIVAADGSGAVDGARFPGFARLADGASWYRNSTTVAPITDAAVPAILTGNYPESTTRAAVLANHPGNLFTLLGGSYTLNAHESVTQLCPIALCNSNRSRDASQLARIEDVVSDTAGLWRRRVSPHRTIDIADLAGVFALDPNPMGTANRFAGSIRRSSEPRLDFLHVFLPHLPWQYLPDGRSTGASGQEPGLVANRWSSDWAATSGRQRHLMQLQAADRVVGSVLDRLEAIDAYDDALVVVTADHGVAFQNGEPVRGLSAANAAEIAWTPLFVKLPGQQAGSIDDRPVRSIDVLPTIADVVGVDVPWNPDGRSLLAPPADGAATAPRLIDWELNTLHPEPGEQYVTLDGEAGFAVALGGRPLGTTGPERDDPLALHRLGPFGALVGLPLSSLPTPAGGGGTARLDHPERLVGVRPSAPVLAAVDVSGDIDAANPSGADAGESDADGDQLLVVVNGVVAATSEAVAVADPDELRWWTRLPAAALIAGTNDLRLFRVSGTPGSPALAEVRLG